MQNKNSATAKELAFVDVFADSSSDYWIYG
jgi:hypothetical protein